MPHLESNILALLQATGGTGGGLTAGDLSELVHEPEGRVRMTLRRLLDRGEVYVTAGAGADARYLLGKGRPRTRRSGGADDFGWGRTDWQRPGEGPAAGSSDLAGELARLRSEVALLRVDNQQLREALIERRATGTPDLGDRLDVLLQLCHPDRHDNSERANETTRWLLDLRKKRL